MTTLLVTGGAGFIGSSLALRLADECLAHENLTSETRARAEEVRRRLMSSGVPAPVLKE